MTKAMLKRTMTSRWGAVGALALSAIVGTLVPLAAIAAPTSAPASASTASTASTASMGAATGAAAGAVRISVTRVRATSPAEAGGSIEVDSKLEKLQIPRLRLGYAKYSQDQVVDKTVAWGEPLSIPVDATLGDSAGRYEIVAVRAGAQPSRLVLRVKEIAPSAKEPCLELETEVQAGRLNLWFCDAVIDGGTMLFFVRAEAAGP